MPENEDEEASPPETEADRLVPVHFPTLAHQHEFFPETLDAGRGVGRAILFVREHRR